jgi:hypothetical protein
MTQTSYPFDSTDTTEAQYSQLFRRLNFTGIAGTVGDSNVKVTGDSSGMNVKVAVGYAMVRGHFYKNDAIVTLTISAASSNPRRDLIVLKLDPTANSITLVVKAGTAASTPTDPSLTQTDEGIYEFPIARVNIAGSATTISAGNVEDLRQFMGAPFGRWTTALRPSSPELGLSGFNTSTGIPEVWNGSAWQGFNDGVSASNISSTEQANIVAGKIRAGGTSSGAATTIFVQSATPTANATGDLWFW